MRSRHYVLIHDRREQAKMSLMRSRYYVLTHNRDEQAKMSLMWSRYYVLTHNRGEQTKMSLMWSRHYVLTITEGNKHGSWLLFKVTCNGNPTHGRKVMPMLLNSNRFFTIYNLNPYLLFPCYSGLVTISGLLIKYSHDVDDNQLLFGNMILPNQCLRFRFVIILKLNLIIYPFYQVS